MSGGIRKAALELSVDHAVVSRHLRALEAAFHVSLARRGERFRIEGERAVVHVVAATLDELYARTERPLSLETVQLTIATHQRSLPDRHPTSHHRHTDRST